MELNQKPGKNGLALLAPKSYVDPPLVHYFSTVLAVGVDSAHCATFGFFVAAGR